MTGSPSDPPPPAGRTTSEEDVPLLERLRRDDREALGDLYDRYSRLALGVATRMLGDGAEAEDVVQESFLAVWRTAHRLDADRGSVRTYLLTIVHRRAIDALRRRSGRPVLDIEGIDLPSPGGDPLEFASKAEERDRVRGALAGLPDDQRRAVELTYFGGLTIAEMAGQEQIPLGTAKSRLRLALERLRKALGADTT
jgi:RNA polymerase sigma-70 factor (ECF subfamily)